MSERGKASHVRSAGQTRPHHCHWTGCERNVPPAMWGCREHWFRLPKRLRDRVWAAYRPGQEEDGDVSATYFAVANDVQAWIRHAVAPPAPTPEAPASTTKED